jgi:hypothetical protein
MTVDPDISRRSILRGSAGVVISGTAAVVASRLGSNTAVAQDATPAAADVSAYPEVVYVGAEYSFTGPAEIPGGLTRVTLQNDGAMDHHAMFFRFNDGKSMADLPAAAAAGLGGLFAIGASVGGPGSVGGGQKSTVVMDLAAGNYVILCVIPDEDGVPHAMKGMLLPLTVTDPAGAATAPVAGGTIEMADFHFEGLPEQVTAGQQVWNVVNAGEQLHELVINQLSPGVTYDQIEAIFLAPPEASPVAGMEETAMAGMEASPAGAMGPPFVAVTGVAPISPGMSNWIVADLVAGEYFAICFVPDPATGAPHFALGMIQRFTVA